MRGYSRISRYEFYRDGAFSNPRLLEPSPGPGHPRRCLGLLPESRMRRRETFGESLIGAAIFFALVGTLVVLPWFFV